MRFEHNCPNCRFLGEEDEYDLYFCTNEEQQHPYDHGNKLVVLRSSGTHHGFSRRVQLAENELPPPISRRAAYAKARRLARRAGYIDGEYPGKADSGVGDALERLKHVVR